MSERAQLRARRRAELLARLTVDPGQCSTCLHLDLVASSRSVFVRCGLAQSDRRFRRYPPLPVLGCPGYEGAEDGSSR